MAGHALPQVHLDLCCEDTLQELAGRAVIYIYIRDMIDNPLLEALRGRKHEYVV